MRQLLENLRARGFLRSERVYRAMERVPRELFVPEGLRAHAYEDRPLPIGYGQTISAPHMVAIMTEALDPPECGLALEVGAGSGYQAAVLAELVDRGGRGCGHVVSFEIVPQLAEYALGNLKRSGHSGSVSIVAGDGGSGSGAGREVFDRILVTAAAPRIPDPLLAELKRGGRLVIPLGSPEIQVLTIVEKTAEGKIFKIEDTPCIFVPMRGVYGFQALDN